MQSLGAGQIEVRFVDRYHFEDLRKLPEDGGHAIAPFRIERVPAIEEDRMRTETPRGTQGHRRVDSKFSCFIARSRHHAALVGSSAYDYRLAAKLRPLQQFHRDEEGVHVHMQNGRLREGRLALGWAVLGS